MLGLSLFFLLLLQLESGAIRAFDPAPSAGEETEAQGLGDPFFFSAGGLMGPINVPVASVYAGTAMMSSLPGDPGSGLSSLCSFSMHHPGPGVWSCCSGREGSTGGVPIPGPESAATMHANPSLQHLLSTLCKPLELPCSLASSPPLPTLS
jgi:hypothetical protein